ncbi:MAG TPA: DUF1257 domain-containing protein [Armatimonadota bacterium]|nr:DUF1257 domain-containing protein [Armatimonadota bacterium]
MSCGIELGFILADLAILLIATHAKGVAVGRRSTETGQTLQSEHNARLIREAAMEAFDSDEVAGQSTADEMHRTLEQAGVAAQFEGADVLVRADNDDIIGLRRDKQGIYQVVAKWRPGVADRLRVDTSGVEQKYRQRYAYLKVKKEAERLGYQVAEEEILPDQSIRVCVRRWD